MCGRRRRTPWRCPRRRRSGSAAAIRRRWCSDPPPLALGGALAEGEANGRGVGEGAPLKEGEPLCEGDPEALRLGPRKAIPMAQRVVKEGAPAVDPPWGSAAGATCSPTAKWRRR